MTGSKPKPKETRKNYKMIPLRLCVETLPWESNTSNPHTDTWTVEATGAFSNVVFVFTSSGIDAQTNMCRSVIKVWAHAQTHTDAQVEQTDGQEGKRTADRQTHGRTGIGTTAVLNGSWISKSDRIAGHTVQYKHSTMIQCASKNIQLNQMNFGWLYAILKNCLYCTKKQVR